MAEKRKFAALAELHRQPVEAEAPEAAVVSAPPPTPEPQAEKGRGRPATGKRSNPEWKLYSHFLKRQTALHHFAVRTGTTHAATAAGRMSRFLAAMVGRPCSLHRALVGDRRSGCFRLPAQPVSLSRWGYKPKPPEIPSADDFGSQQPLWPGSLTFSRTKRP